MNASPTRLEPATVPTMYFVGVTTTKSSIMKIFPRWSDILGIGARLVGYDAPLHAPAETYRAIVEHIKHDPLSMGGLVTTHKIDLLAATRDLFDYLDPYAELCDEISSISKRDERLEGHAIDPISSELAWKAFVEPGYWGRTNAEVLCLGAGGAAVAINVFVAGIKEHADRPRKFIVVDRDQPRLDAFKQIAAKLSTEMQYECVLSDDPRQNDVLMAALPAGSLVINATGMGKDRPGSPITDEGIFPEDGIAWELNYRGELDFLRQAERQAASRSLKIEDGWIYFVHGWSQVVAQIFHKALTPAVFAELNNAASSFR